MIHNVLFLEVFLLSSWTTWNFALIPGAKPGPLPSLFIAPSSVSSAVHKDLGVFLDLVSDMFLGKVGLGVLANCLDGLVLR